MSRQRPRALPRPWQALPTGIFTGTDWSAPDATAGHDPYLVWAETDHFAGYHTQPPAGHGHPSCPTWLPIVIELAEQTSVAALIAASSTDWLQIPRAYLGLSGLRFCSARVKPAFFTELQRPPLRQLVQRYELGLPVGSHTGPIQNPCSRFALKAGAPVSSDNEALLSGKVLGLIDGGLALANAAFLTRGGKPRVQHFWRQDSRYKGPWPSQDHHVHAGQPLDPQRAGPTPTDMGYGHSLNASAIAQAMARFTARDADGQARLDEEALYRHLQLWDLALPVSHGTHVMSQACAPGGELHPRDDAASRADLVAVQLDWATVRDTSGGAMNVSVLDGLMFILARCAPSAEVVVNISWGTLAGPHDGSSILESAMDQLIDLLGGRLQIVVPAGNGYQSRTHANARLRPGKPLPLHWRVQPDDHTQSFLEIWLPEGAQDVEITLTPPGHHQPLPALRMGEAATWKGAGPHPQCALIYPSRSALGRRGTCALLALAPTASLHAGVTTAPCGVWQVSLLNKGQKALPFDAYIERDDVALGQHTGARQSYLEDPDYDTSGNLHSWMDKLKNRTPVRRSGTFNSLSTGERTVSVGGTRRHADPNSPVGPFALYSPQRPDPAKRPTQRPGVKTEPKALKPSDDNPALWGQLGAGTLSGSVARLAGTSSSAPQMARDLVNGVRLATPDAPSSPTRR